MMNREERLERTMSMAQNKGLLNNPGQNNCFLNSAVQVFWHLDVFRRSFREIKGHFCMGKSCIFCALQNIFKEFQYSNNDALPPDALRIAMANTFKDQRKFQMGDMDDAAECFETILSRMHFHLAMKEHDDGCNAKHCITHQKFAMQIIEQVHPRLRAIVSWSLSLTVCPCGEQSEPLPFFQTVHYVSASALCSKARRIEKFLGEEYNHTKHFGTLLRMTGDDTRDCASPECDERTRVQRSLLNCPEIVSVGLNWDSESPDADHIAEVLQCIGTTLKLPYLFHHVYNAQGTSLNLVGIVTYYGKHYSTFVFHSKLKTWIYFDDARVQEIGPDWSVIREKCRRCHYQPLLLLYANPNGTPVNTDTAPREKILINGGTFVRTPDLRPKSRRLSSEFFRYDGERRPRKRHSSNCESNISRTDSESNMSTLKSEKRLSSSEGNDDTLKARDNNTSVHSTWLDDESGTLKANDSSDNQRSRKTDNKARKDEKSPRSRRSKSCDTLDDGTLRKKPGLTRMNSTGSDVTETLKRKKRASTGKDKQKKTGLRRIGSAIIQAMRPATAITHMKTSRKKNKDRRPSDTSTESNGERGSMELSPDQDATMTQQDLLHLYEQAQSDDYLRSPSHDSGIGSATGSVSSNDTTHGGSDEDLVEYSHTLYALRNGGQKPKSSSTRINKSRTSEHCEVLLQDGDNMVLRSQNAENSGDCMSALRFCAEAATSFRKASEISGISSNNGKYAVIKKDQCQVKIKQLRKKIEDVSTSNMAKLPKREDNEVLRQQRIRDEMILKQQLQNHAQYGTLPRNPPTLHKQVSPPSATLLHSRQDSPPKLEPRIPQEYHSIIDPMSCTLPIKPKRVSSNHYMNKINQTRNECTQKIKPDSMCYSPTHYDDMTGKMMGLNIHQPSHINGYSPNERFSYENPSTIQKNLNALRSYTSDSEATKPRPPERKISSTATIYLQPTRSDSYVMPRRGGYDPMNYITTEQEQPRQSKVYYAGASDINTGKDPGLRSRSYDNMETSISSHSSGRVPFDALPPSYRPSPPSYQSIQQSRASINNSNISPQRAWYQDNTSMHSEPLLGSSAPANLRAVSARIIADRPVCESCLQVPIGRQQRICAGCVDEQYRKHHRQLQDRTDMLY